MNLYKIKYQIITNTSTITNYVHLSKLVLREVVPIQLVFLCLFLEAGCIDIMS